MPVDNLQLTLLPACTPSRSFDEFARMSLDNCKLTTPISFLITPKNRSFDEFARMSLDNVFLLGKLEEYREAFK
jgi:hypothetical protein